MSTAYALLLGLVIFLGLFIYFVFFTVSLRLEKNEKLLSRLLLKIYLLQLSCYAFDIIKIPKRIIPAIRT